MLFVFFSSNIFLEITQLYIEE